MNAIKFACIGLIFVVAAAVAGAIGIDLNRGVLDKAAFLQFVAGLLTALAVGCFYRVIEGRPSEPSLSEAVPGAQLARKLSELGTARQI
jgi:hypothetical protein